MSNPIKTWCEKHNRVRVHKGNRGRTVCRDCDAEYNRIWRAQNPERLREIKNRYNAKRSKTPYKEIENPEPSGREITPYVRKILDITGGCL